MDEKKRGAANGEESACAVCPFGNGKRICRTQGGEGSQYPKSCATVNGTETLSQAFSEYTGDEELHRFALQAAVQEGSGYGDVDGVPGMKKPTKTRIEEVMEFCKRMGYQKLGLAFCGGLHSEAAILNKILTAHGFQVVSAVCKVGGVDKTELGIEEADKIWPGKAESICNPIAQAMILNEAGTEFNLVLGLCVGHDSMFFKYSEAMCTVIAVKDRLMAHNPLGAIYSGYYKYLLETPEN